MSDRTTPVPGEAVALHIFGETLKRAREAKGFTTRALAEAAGIDHSMVVKIEGGKKRTANETLARIGDALGIKLVEHMGGQGPGGAQAPPSLADPDVIRVPLDLITHDGINPRTHRDEGDIEDLAESIFSKGVLIPLLARPPRDGFKRYRVYDGGTRLEALDSLRNAGKIDSGTYLVPLKVRDLDDGDALLESLVAGKRSDLNPMDECEAFAQLAEFGKATAEVAAAKGVNIRTVQLRIQVARMLEPDAKLALREGTINLAQAEALAGAETKEDQGHALTMIRAGTLKTESQVREYLAGLKSSRQAARERDAHVRFKTSRPADDMARRSDAAKSASSVVRQDPLDVPPYLARSLPKKDAEPPAQMDIEDLTGGRSPPAKEAAPAETAEQRWYRVWKDRLGGFFDRLEPPEGLDGPPAALGLVDADTGRICRFVFSNEEDWDAWAKRKNAR